MPKPRVDFDPSQFQTFGELLRYLRERARLSQRDLAQRVGYHYSYLSRLEKNARPPDKTVLQTRFVPALRIENEPAWTQRLLDLASVEHAPAASEEEPADRPRWEARLPVSLTPLLGRESESGALFQILTSEEIRLVTLIGPPGVGKTRLSLHVAEQLASQFEDGAVFVDLMPILDPQQVIPALAAALGAQESIGASMLENIELALHEREALIVMDNFEQVLDAAPHLLALLSAAPGVKILATSREALRLRGEQEFPLAPLPVPDEKAGSALDFPSVQLFVQRARAAKPDFHLDEQDGRRVAEICRRLDGLPLAIELAAARVRTFTPADMLEQFDRRFQWLASTARDIPEWRRTLWSAVAWSYNLLTEHERILFERLSVFAGGWTVEAATAICCNGSHNPCPGVLNVLMQLVDKSLVVSEAGSRFRFLDTIQKFAHEKLAERDGLEEAGNRHLRYFVDWAEGLDAQYYSLSPSVFQARTGADLNNVRAALDWALSHREVFVDGLRLAVPANLIFLEHGLIRDEYERAQVFLREADHPSLKARLLLRTAALGMRIGQDGLSYEYCRKAEGIARELNEKRLLADSLLALGDSDRFQSRYDPSVKALVECVALYRELNLLPELNRSLTSLGGTFFYLDRLEDSNAAINEAIEIAESIQDITGQADALRRRASQLGRLGKHAEAFAIFKRALELSRASGDRPYVGTALVNLSILSNLLEDYPASEKYAAESISVFQSIGDEDQQAFPRRMQAYALLQQGLPTRARPLALESLRANLNGGIGVLNCLTALAEIHLSQGNLEPAARLFGFLAPRVKEKFSEVNPDSRSFERIGRALAGRDTECWQAEGASMNLEEAAALASRGTRSGRGHRGPKPSIQQIRKTKRSGR